MFKKILLAAVCACTALGGQQARANDYVRGYTRSNGTYVPHRKPVSFPARQSKQARGDGLSYETFIPRPTWKGYYEPKIVPYPKGKPVFVHGYFRKNGTYVHPHFRSLPRR
ncbi:MAG TPA: hypothetical protein VG013_01055 [Gemmataceae bacterium]|jgi:hypothetical protein|nr:hypothetical protein [Gemmataceae bacterium]